MEFSTIRAIEHPRGIHEEIDYKLIGLSMLYTSSEQSKSYETIETLMRNEIRADTLPETLAREFLSVTPKSENGEIFDLHFLRALAYYLLAEHEVNNGNETRGWMLFSEANYYTGFMDGILSDTTTKEAEKKSADSRKGGKATAQKHVLIQEEAARLIACKAPPKGWKNKKAAIQGIEEYLGRFIEERSLGKLVRNPTGTLTKWMSQVPAIKESFDKNSAKAHNHSRI
ncbi:hypothetical protein [Pseudomonas sp. P42]|uniref:hypothetical protein n=1 Tax=Pseudomonas sp. P42 TaxID=1080160 RepID=UPI001B3402E7|nr:hypothetical protein [Pseudomonas sp. P42]MBP5953429.1 hypothetical protein [Pseudomonas sp. P42]